jgi:hypothetical protein
MIISHKHKYIFIGLPFSASSAISKELIELYDGDPLYHKHSNIPLLIKKSPDIQIKDYLIFAVVREPLEMVFSVYNKFLTNPHNTFTDSKYFIENGGFVSKKARENYQWFQHNKPTFKEFLVKRYKYIPYDNNLSINSEYINEFIRFEHLNEDFHRIINTIGLKPKRDLPLYNRTKKIYDNKDEVSQSEYMSFFGMHKWMNRGFYNYGMSNKPPFINRVYFHFFQKIRFYKIMKYDLRQMSNNFSIVDLKNER